MMTEETCEKSESIRTPSLVDALIPVGTLLILLGLPTTWRDNAFSTSAIASLPTMTSSYREKRSLLRKGYETCHSDNSGDHFFGGMIKG
jgi:hypothetical protein